MDFIDNYCLKNIIILYCGNKTCFSHLNFILTDIDKNFNDFRLVCFTLYEIFFIILFVVLANHRSPATRPKTTATSSANYWACSSSTRNSKSTIRPAKRRPNPRSKSSTTTSSSASRRACSSTSARTCSPSLSPTSPALTNATHSSSNWMRSASRVSTH